MSGLVQAGTPRTCAGRSTTKFFLSLHASCTEVFTSSSCSSLLHRTRLLIRTASCFFDPQIFTTLYSNTIFPNKKIVPGKKVTPLTLSPPRHPRPNPRPTSAWACSRPPILHPCLETLTSSQAETPHAQRLKVLFSRPKKYNYKLSRLSHVNRS